MRLDFGIRRLRASKKGEIGRTIYELFDILIRNATTERCRVLPLYFKDILEDDTLE